MEYATHQELSWPGRRGPPFGQSPGWDLPNPGRPAPQPSQQLQYQRKFWSWILKKNQKIYLWSIIWQFNLTVNARHFTNSMTKTLTQQWGAFLKPMTGSLVTHFSLLTGDVMLTVHSGKYREVTVSVPKGIAGHKALATYLWHWWNIANEWKQQLCTKQWPVISCSIVKQLKAAVQECTIPAKTPKTLCKLWTTIKQVFDSLSWGQE